MSAIIKASGVRGDDRGIGRVALDFSDMTDQAKDYLGDVNKQAERIIARANDEAEKIRRRAEEEGRGVAIQAAVKTLRGEVQQQLQTLLPALRKVVEEIHQARSAWVRHWNKQVVHLATAIAQRIVRRELARSPDITLDLVTEALQLAAGSGKIKLHLNPRDHAALGEHIESLVAEIEQLAPADVIADPKITPGGCRVVTSFGVIDQQLEAQLARIEEELT